MDQHLLQTFSELRNHFVFIRIFLEDEDVIGNGLFSRRRTADNFELHILGNILRVLLILIFAPIYTFSSLAQRAIHVNLNPVQAWWGVEFASTPRSVLATAPSTTAHGTYEPSNLPPRFLLEVDYERRSWRQVPWSIDIRYTALSYSYASAEHLVVQRQNVSQPPSPDQPIFLLPRTYEHDRPFPGGQEALNALQERHRQLFDRQVAAREFLLTYMDSRLQQSPPPTIEFIWLDEFCLSDASLRDIRHLVQQREREVGRLADIFRGAEKVCVFCHIPNCGHATLECPWGTRLFTLAEILHARSVVRMTLRPKWGYVLEEEEGRFFREKMQAHAAISGRWHLYGIMQHANNSGSATWQTAIHSLLVEAILRDEAGGFASHKYLGKGLNGLLPRRACLADLTGRDGWDDLAWLLELNQGFYNAASLAAVCGVAEAEPHIPEHFWLGPPIRPDVGNERLEPCVTAFPVPFALSVLAPLTIKIHRTLKRDSLALYKVAEMRGLLYLSVTILVLFIVMGGALLRTRGATGFFVPIYMGFVVHSAFMIVAGSMYLIKSGWVLLREEQWAGNPSSTNTLRTWLGRRDSRLTKIDDWGPEGQLTPDWPRPQRAQKITLLDLEYHVAVETYVLYSDRINALAPLAIHGCGLTCMVLERPNVPRGPARKVGMVNMPPYVRHQSKSTSTLYVGRNPSVTASYTPSQRLSHYSARSARSARTT